MRVKQKTATPRISLPVTNVEKLESRERLERLEPVQNPSCVGWNVKSPEWLERLGPANPYGSITSFRCGSWAKE